MLSMSLRRLVPRFFLMSMIIGVGAGEMTAREWKCPNCYRCAGGCSIGSNSYGFDKCKFVNGSCQNDGGNPCCEGEDDPPPIED
jgi:hypothetical protein